MMPRIICACSDTLGLPGADKQDISNFQWWLLIFNYEMPCRSNATPGPIREVIQVRASYTLLLWQCLSWVRSLPSLMVLKFKVFDTRGTLHMC